MGQGDYYLLGTKIERSKRKAITIDEEAIALVKQIQEKKKKEMKQDTSFSSTSKKGKNRAQCDDSTP